MYKHLVKKATLAYASGSFGALLNSFALYVAAMIGLSTLFGVSMMTEWSLEWLYPRLVWGGVLAFLFVLPVYQTRWLVRGLVWSIVPTIPHLFIIFPGQADVAGETVIEVGVITLICVYIFNCIWGLITSYMLHVFRD